MTTNNELEWCMKYGYNFPNDRKTALNFISCKFAERATAKATTKEHLAAIAQARQTAETMIANQN